MVPKIATLVVGVLFLGLAAIMMNIDQLYFMMAVLLCIPVVAYTFSRISLRQLQWRRQMPQRAYEGERFAIRLDVHNAGWMPRFFITVQEKMSPWLRPVGAVSFVIPVIWPRSTHRLEYEVEAVKRGEHTIGPSRVSGSDPLGLFRHRRRASAPTSVLIYPRPVPIAAPEGSGFGAQSTAQTDAWWGRREGDEFFGIRSHQPGDELRRIHWKVSARRGDLTVMEFKEDDSGDLFIVLDLERGTEVGEGKDTTLEHAVRMAASLAKAVLDQGAEVRLAACGRDGLSVVEAAGPRELVDVLESLARAQADGDLSLPEALTEIEGRVPAGSRVMILTSRLGEDLAAALRRLTGRGLAVAVVYFDPARFALATLGRRGKGEGVRSLVEAGAAVRVVGPTADPRREWGVTFRDRGA